MGGRQIDLAGWPRAAQFRFFRGYARPQYAVTSRLDVTALMTRRKPAGQSAYRACLHAIGAGIHGVPELRQRFRGETVTEYDRIDLSMTVPAADGSFRYAYLGWQADFAAFDSAAVAAIAEAAAGPLNANAGERLDLAYLSCLPWLDFTAITNALPGPEDCIPRVSWGRITEEAPGRWRMAMAIEVHHALVDGLHVGQFMAAVQAALDA